MAAGGWLNCDYIIAARTRRAKHDAGHALTHTHATLWGHDVREVCMFSTMCYARSRSRWVNALASAREHVVEIDWVK